MSDTDKVLPKYDNPPVVEVALSVQFEKLSALRTPQLGLLWSSFREQFPKIEEHQPIEAAFERFDNRMVQKAGIRLEHMEKPPVPRIWFIKEDGTELIQIQQDRFVHNWRKVGKDDKYPHYEEKIRSAFIKNLNKFKDFLTEQNIGDLIPNQCEVTYVNHIILGEDWSSYGKIGNVLTIINPVYSDNFLSEPEDARLALKYVMPDLSNPEGPPLGRLHISCEPAFLPKEDQPIFQLKLTARGKPIGEGLDGAIKFMDIGREWVVRGFTSITTELTHKIWRKHES